jgi:hypothetical protein
MDAFARLSHGHRMRLFAFLLGVLVITTGVGLAQAEGVEPVEGGWKGIPMFKGLRAPY